MPVDHLWATWRSAYVQGGSDRDGEVVTDDGRSLFERILAAGTELDAPDRDTGVVRRGDRCFVLLNRFPYTSGHLMVLPNRAVADLETLDAAEYTELWLLVRAAVVALKAGVGCEAVNVGVNLGRAAGGSQAD
ncbi:MAG: HIT domain-containing protein, partial [Actinomycetes bacterium]